MQLAHSFLATCIYRFSRTISPRGSPLIRYALFPETGHQQLGFHISQSYHPPILRASFVSLRTSTGSPLGAHFTRYTAHVTRSPRCAPLTRYALFPETDHQRLGFHISGYSREKVIYLDNRFHAEM